MNSIGPYFFRELLFNILLEKKSYFPIKYKVDVILHSGTQIVHKGNMNFLLSAKPIKGFPSWSSSNLDVLF